MNAVLHESMRVAALVGTGVAHYTTADVPVGKLVIPKDTIVFGSIYHIMNDPEHFKNPHLFKPERFIDGQGKFVADEQVAPFGVGKRMCLGHTLAEKQFYIFFAGLIQQFELQKDPNKKLPSYLMDDTFPKGVLRTVPFFTVILKHRLRV
jgi:cytochrome P450